MATIIKEKSTAYLTVTFKDKDGNAEAPTAATYRIDDVDSGAPIRTDTPLNPATSVEINLEPSDNTLLDSTKPEEERRVTVKATYGATDGVNDEYIYQLKNLEKVS